ncbi:50S ribosomal protein L24 [Candidatus Micrarchaeota archaeon]|nr:50S ribosomal protein L24 [Candidatus Micrarchaeota archaeon]
MKFNTKITKQARKKRKQLFTAPIHTLKKNVSIHLSKDLRTKTKKRAMPAKKGDKAKVMRGVLAKKEGKIIRVDVKKTRIYLEGISKKTARGKEELIAFHPSNLMLTEITERKKAQKVVKNG